MDAFQDLNDLYFFARVVDCGSYTAAAEALGMQTSKLSRRIGALERELGVRLLNRTTRKLSFTEAGNTLHRHCVALIAEAEAARDAINQTLSAPRGLVRVSCPPACFKAASPISSGGISPRTPRFRSHSRRPIGESTSSMRASTSRFGCGCLRSTIPTWRCGHSVRRT
jgi:DNA-binding transcriptional LysR family regulator